MGKENDGNNLHNKRWQRASTGAMRRQPLRQPGERRQQCSSFERRQVCRARSSSSGRMHAQTWATRLTRMRIIKHGASVRDDVLQAVWDFGALARTGCAHTSSCRCRSGGKS